MQLDIPVRNTFSTPTTVEEPDAYYDFLEQPPVERVERLYSVDEVKRSARIRDKTRRIDLDTLTFEFGSRSIAGDQSRRARRGGEGDGEDPAEGTRPRPS